MVLIESTIANRQWSTRRQLPKSWQREVLWWGSWSNTARLPTERVCLRHESIHLAGVESCLPQGYTQASVGTAPRRAGASCSAKHIASREQAPH